MPRDQRSQQYHGERDYDPEFDARNYRGGHGDSREKGRRSAGDGGSGTPHQQQRAAANAAAELFEGAQAFQEGYAARERPSSGKHRRSKHRKKHSRDGRDDRKKKARPTKLVDYDDVSTNSDTFSAQSSPVVGRGAGRLPPSPPPDHADHRGRRGPASPNTYSSQTSKHNQYDSRPHTPPSPNHYDPRVDDYTPALPPVKSSSGDGGRKSSSGKSSSSRKSSSQHQHGISQSSSHSSQSGNGGGRQSVNSGPRSPSPSPKNYRTVDAPKAYADPPRAYRPADETGPSPSPAKRIRYRNGSRSPSPYDSYRDSRSRRNRSPSSPHR